MTQSKTPSRARSAGAAGALAACFALSGCGGGFSALTPRAQAPAGNSLAAQTSMRPDLIKKIKHVVIIIQENRSFDNMFHHYPGAETADTGKDSLGNTITLTAQPLAYLCDFTHRFQQAVTSIDYVQGKGKMDGFNLVPGSGNHCAPSNPQYVYTKQADVQKYWDMAGQYVLADHFFESQLDGSFEGHQYLIAGQAEKTWGIPTGTTWGCDGGSNNTLELLDSSTKPGTPTTNKVPVCFDQPNTPFDTTLADELDAAGVSWKYYAPAAPGLPGNDPGYIWSAFDAINHIRNGPEWTTNVISPPKQFITDVAAGTMAGVTWIVPDLSNSDHPGNAATKSGPAWVTSLVDAVGTSQFWNSSAIFVVWDDWGGLYDHVPPPLLDYDGLGIRVPLITISPFALKGKVTKKQYEFGSILKFAEATFGLAHMAASDTRANSFNTGLDMFNFNHPPRAFTKFSTRSDRQFFLNQAPSNQPPDDD